MYLKQPQNKHDFCLYFCGRDKRKYSPLSWSWREKTCSFSLQIYVYAWLRCLIVSTQSHKIWPFVSWIGHESTHESASVRQCGRYAERVWWALWCAVVGPERFHTSVKLKRESVSCCGCTTRVLKGPCSPALAGEQLARFRVERTPASSWPTCGCEEKPSVPFPPLISLNSALLS